MGRSETSVGNYDYSTRNNPEKRSCQIPLEICYGYVLLRTVKLWGFIESSWVMINFWSILYTFVSYGCCIKKSVTSVSVPIFIESENKKFQSVVETSWNTQDLQKMALLSSQVSKTQQLSRWVAGSQRRIPKDLNRHVYTRVGTLIVATIYLQLI